ncbi:MAG: hypothetical protein ACOX47_02935 [Bacillota bacterium]
MGFDEATRALIDDFNQYLTEDLKGKVEALKDANTCLAFIFAIKKDCCCNPIFYDLFYFAPIPNQKQFVSGQVPPNLLVMKHKASKPFRKHLNLLNKPLK